MQGSITLRLYEHPDTRASVEGERLEGEVTLRGWDHVAGQIFFIGDTTYRLSEVMTTIHNGRHHMGGFVYAKAAPNVAPTVKPVEQSGWYELTDGRWGRYTWRSGRLHLDEVVASLADITTLEQRLERRPL